jgi:Protein of unknown function (DUF3108)
VKRWILALWIALAVSLPAPLFAADWRDSLTPLKPGTEAPIRPLTANYKFGWTALTAASADFEFTRAKGNQMRLAVHARTTGAVRALWRMDAEHEAYCDATTLRPIRLEQTETYKAKTEIANATFSPDWVERWRETKPAGDPPKKRRVNLAGVYDLQTALLMIRSQRLRPGDVYRLIVFPSKAPYLAEVDVIGKDTLKVAGATYPAIKCQIKLQGITKQLTLEPHKKFKEAFAWMSDDRDRLLLKIKAEIFVGSVWAELTSVKFAE